MSKKKSGKGKPSNVIAQNRKARHDYEILHTVEGGLVLQGTEVKSLREGNGNINECYANFDKNGELWLINSFIAPYSHGGEIYNHDERRSRKILLHKKELIRLAKEKDQETLTLIPLKLYWKKGKVKVEIALGRGKKSYDKRHAIKARDWNRQKQRLLK